MSFALWFTNSTYMHVCDTKKATKRCNSPSEYSVAWKLQRAVRTGTCCEPSRRLACLPFRRYPLIAAVITLKVEMSVDQVGWFTALSKQYLVSAFDPLRSIVRLPGENWSLVGKVSWVISDSSRKFWNYEHSHEKLVYLKQKRCDRDLKVPSCSTIPVPKNGMLEFLLFFFVKNC